jgi:capsular polysaccharide biosynthesis protein
MQLSYVTHAMKRYWWIVLAGLLLGIAAGVALHRPAQYASHATVAIDPRSAGVPVGQASDRFVATEVGLLQSEAFQQQVADHLGSGYSAGDLQGAVTVTQRIDTYVVDMVAKAAGPMRAQAIAGAYADVYSGLSSDEMATQKQQELSGYDARLQAVQDQLTAVDKQIANALAGYLPAKSATTGFNAIPTVDQVAPGLSSQKTALLNQYAQLRAARDQFDLSSASTPVVEVIERATEPRIDGHRAALVIGPLALLGLLVGAVGAVLLARASRRVLDAEEVAEITGQPIFAEIPQSVGRVQPPPGRPLPPPALTFLDELCARVESAPHDRGPLTVLICSSDRTPAPGALAAAMGNRFTESGFDVALVSADRLAEEQFLWWPGPHLRLGDLLRDAPAANAAPWVSDLPAPSVSRLTFVGVAEPADAVALRRQGPEAALAAVGRREDVVIVAGGPLLETGTTTQLAPLVEVVVLVVPVRRQRRERLHAVLQRLSSRRGDLIVVDGSELTGRTVRPGPRRRRSPRPEPDALVDVPAETDGAVVSG